MMIPKTAANPLDAITLMDYFYDPDTAAGLTEYINYVTPVSTAKQVILQKAATATGDDKKTLTDLATSPLVFPTPADYAKLRHYRSFRNPQEQILYEALFQPLLLR
jgi:spermidine/putrescine transport system substrate-binding protein